MQLVQKTYIKRLILPSLQTPMSYKLANNLIKQKSKKCVAFEKLLILQVILKPSSIKISIKQQT